MLRALNLLFTPETTWQKTALKPPHILTVLLISILPLMVVALGLEAYAMANFGETLSGIGRRTVSPDRAIKYAVFYGAASLTVILIGAGLLKHVAESFNLKSSFATCLILIAFAYSPIFYGRLLDAIPAINTWICWAVGVALAMRILYHGVAWWLQPEQTKGFGLFILTFIYVAILSALVHFASLQVLHGHFLKNIMESSP